MEVVRRLSFVYEPFAPVDTHYDVRHFKDIFPFHLEVQLILSDTVKEALEAVSPDVHLLHECLVAHQGYRFSAGGLEAGARLKEDQADRLFDAADLMEGVKGIPVHGVLVVRSCLFPTGRHPPLRCRSAGMGIFILQ